MHVRRFQGADAQPRAAGPAGSQRPVHGRQQIPEVRSRGKVAAIVTQVDAAQGNLPDSGIEQKLRFADHVLWVAADGAASGRGDDAVGAAVGAAVLNLDHARARL
jgi:hypothetical protein